MLVGIAGLAGSGKSAAAAHLQAHHGFTIVSMADPMKHLARELFGFTDRQLYGPSSARSEPHATIRRPDGTPLTARYALQTLGDWGKMCSASIWIDCAMRMAQKHTRVVIPDVRFVAELEAVRALGGKVIRRRVPIGNVDPHPSETEMLSVPDSAFDAVLPIYPDLSHLYSAIDGLLVEWGMA